MSESAKKSLVIFIYAGLILSTLLVFWQARNFDFVNFDDNDYVYENQHVLDGLSWDGVVWAFTTPVSNHWHPLTTLSLMLNCQLFGPDPGWMHLTNILLHLANTLLLFTVLRKMTGSLWPSAFVAAAFALHPMHVESVAWITERKDVLSTLFFLLTLAAYYGYVKRPTAVRYVGALVLFALGLMAKAMLVTVPFVLLLLDYWPLNRFDPQPAKASGRRKHDCAPIHDGLATLYRLVIEKIPFLVLSVVSSVIAFLTQQTGGGMISTRTVPLMDRVANALLSYAVYMGKMFWPQGLAPFYPLDAGAIQFWHCVLYALLLVGVSVAVLCYWRTRKYLAAGWFWFIGMPIPVIGLVLVGNCAYADRYTYIPYIGLFIMVAWGLPELLSRWVYRRYALATSAVVALTVLGVIAHRQVSYWSNSVVLFSHAIEVTRDNYIAYYNRGTAYIKLDRWQEAIEDYGHTIRIKSNYFDAFYNRGIAYGKLDRWQEVIEDYSQAIRIRPDHAEAYNSRGIAYGKLGRGTEAIEDFSRAIRIDPNYAEAHHNLGVAYGKLGRGAEAIEGFGQVIRIRPDDAEAHYNLAGILSVQNRFEEAVDQYRAAIRLKGDWPDPMNDLAWLIATGPDIKNRDTNEAIRLASHACELANYKNPALLDTLAAAYASAGRFSEAIDTANKALGIADAANQPQLRNDIQYHLSFYRQGKPYIESASKPLPDPNRL
jgi:tetratricopeptide (TPR) repeat protein